MSPHRCGRVGTLTRFTLVFDEAGEKYGGTFYEECDLAEVQEEDLSDNYK